MCVLSTGQIVVRYNNLGSAVYAKEKLNGFEYPPGSRLSVAYIDDGEDKTRYRHSFTLIIFCFIMEIPQCTWFCSLLFMGIMCMLLVCSSIEKCWH